MDNSKIQKVEIKPQLKIASLVSASLMVAISVVSISITLGMLILLAFPQPQQFQIALLTNEATTGGGAGVPTLSAQKWVMLEIPLTANKAYSNPYIAVKNITVKFTGPGGVEKKVSGFWNGTNSSDTKTFAVRFTPTMEGEWSFAITTEDPSDLDLAPSSGLITVAPAPAGQHGFLRRDKDFQSHFVFDDGTRYYMWGQTYYELLRNARSGSAWKTAIDQSKAYGMNKVRMLVYSWPAGNFYPDTEPFQNSAGTLFGADHDRLNLVHWRALDAVVRYLHDQGMIADVIPFTDKPDGASRSRTFGTQAQDERYARYIIARYAAFPNVIWCLTNEWNYTEKPMSYWNAIGQIVRAEDPWLSRGAALRPLSIHQQTRFDFQYFGASWPVHAIVQVGIRNREFSNGDEWGYQSILRNRGPGMPVVNDEYGYIGTLSRGDHRRAMWGISLGGGYGSFGDHRVFPPLSDSGLSGDPQDVILTSDWHSASEYGDVRQLVDFWTTKGIEYWKMQSMKDKISGTRSYALGVEGQEYVVYAAIGGSPKLTVPQGNYTVVRYNPRDGVEVFSDVNNATQITLSSPDTQDWAFHVTRIIPQPLFFRGNADGSSDGITNITDAVYTLRFLFTGGPEPSCMDAADADDNGFLELNDAVFTLRFLFQGGPQPLPPGPFQAGTDPTPDTLGCAVAQGLLGGAAGSISTTVGFSDCEFLRQLELSFNVSLLPLVPACQNFISPTPSPTPSPSSSGY